MMKRSSKQHAEPQGGKCRRGLYAVGLSLAVAQASAGVIDSWNSANVTTEDPPYLLDEVYSSFVFTDDTKTTTNGRVVWVESDVQTPGLATVVDDDMTGQNCVMTAGINPEDGTVKQCSDPFQTSKRFKLVNSVAGTSVDLVFNVSATGNGVDTHRILEKYENITGGRLGGFSIQLGTGTGDDFNPSTPGDGLAFADRNGVPWDLSLRGSVRTARDSSGDTTVNTSLSATANLSLPGEWKLGWRSNFNVETGTFNNQFWTLERKLHDWQLVFRRGLTDGQDFGFSLYLNAIPDLRVDRGDLARSQDFRSRASSF